MPVPEVVDVVVGLGEALGVPMEVDEAPPPVPLMLGVLVELRVRPPMVLVLLGEGEAVLLAVGDLLVVPLLV